MLGIHPICVSVDCLVALLEDEGCSCKLLPLLVPMLPKDDDRLCLVLVVVAAVAVAVVVLFCFFWRTVFRGAGNFACLSLGMGDSFRYTCTLSLALALLFGVGGTAAEGAGAFPVAHASAFGLQH